MADVVRRGIVEGQYRPGGPLPSHAVLAADCGVAVGTVKRALGVLQDEGLIVSRRGQPARVRVQRGAPAVDIDSVSPANWMELRRTLADLERRLAAVERRSSPRSP
ncbi:GntR family transcriptional regulator [Pseudonocardia sp. EV170527-09]|uniref:GntR family transcriptional regulator n=1 Tax=Pseudonocardia sp. EV170527-09 TaxID=2603411 RepID=UPI0034CF53CA